MSNTRKPRNRRRHEPGPRDDTELVRMMLGPVLAADAAEARGDAEGALHVMDGIATDPWGASFWRPGRRKRLQQVVALGALLPGWAVSRCVVEQALQHLEPAGPSPVGRALETAIELRGGLEALPGLDEMDARCKVMDHDWVYRQLHLYEYGGLRRFAASVASPALLKRADRIREWASAPTGGYRYVRQEPGLLVWESLAGGRLVETLDLGAGLLVRPGECVVGRAVPVEGGAMFETSPLWVPDEVAAEVAASPGTWVDSLREAMAAGGEWTGFVARAEFPLLSDLPARAYVDWGLELLDCIRDRWPTGPGAAPTAAAAAGVLCLAFIRNADGLDRPGELLHVWPELAAALLEPDVTGLLEAVLVGEEQSTEGLSVMAEWLTEPAASVCRLLIGRCAVPVE